MLEKVIPSKQSHHSPRPVFQTFVTKILTKFLRYKTKAHLLLEPAKVTWLPGPREGRKYVLYAHVPFCESLCPYCSFNRFMFNQDRASKYFENLRAEMRMVADLGYTFESMYIGGGTPTILVDELAETIDLAKQLFGIKEVSCETNPNHLTPEILSVLRGRVDRLSIGVQSFDDDLLRKMSRYEKFGSGDDILGHIQAAANVLPSLNVDMIFNFPSQTEEILRADIDKLIRSGANQVTFYPLMSAPSVEKAMNRSIGAVDYTREAVFHRIITEEISKVFEPMSAWTFSRHGNKMIDEYIVQYEEYVGVGSGSFSYLDGNLYVNTFSLSEYDASISAGHMSVSAQHLFGKHEQMQYRFMMELFDLKLNKLQFKKDFGVPIERALWKEMVFMAAAGAFAKNEKDILRLNINSSYLMVVMMREFFAGVNTIRDQARAALAPNERLMCVVNEKIMV